MEKDDGLYWDYRSSREVFEETLNDSNLTEEEKTLERLKFDADDATNKYVVYQVPRQAGKSEFSIYNYIRGIFRRD